MFSNQTQTNKWIDPWQQQDEIRFNILKRKKTTNLMFQRDFFPSKENEWMKQSQNDSGKKREKKNWNKVSIKVIIILNNIWK